MLGSFGQSQTDCIVNKSPMSGRVLFFLLLALAQYGWTLSTESEILIKKTHKTSQYEPET